MKAGQLSSERFSPISAQPWVTYIVDLNPLVLESVLKSTRIGIVGNP